MTFLATVEAASGSIAEVTAGRTVSVVSPVLVTSTVAIWSSPSAISEAASTVIAAAGELDLNFLSSDGFAVHAA